MAAAARSRRSTTLSDVRAGRLACALPTCRYETRCTPWRSGHSAPAKPRRLVVAVTPAAYAVARRRRCVARGQFPMPRLRTTGRGSLEAALRCRNPVTEWQACSYRVQSGLRPEHIRELAVTGTSVAISSACAYLRDGRFRSARCLIRAALDAFDLDCVGLRSHAAGSHSRGPYHDRPPPAGCLDGNSGVGDTPAPLRR